MPMHDILQAWQDNPLNFLLSDDDVSTDSPVNRSSPLYVAAKTRPSNLDLFQQTTVSILEGFVAACGNQLKDFLAGGIYASKASDTELNRTQYSHLTNLVCERNFGSLGSSQNCRRYATLHYHSTIDMLKKNRESLFDWIKIHPVSEKEFLFKTACRCGQNLRVKHREEEKTQSLLQQELLAEGTQHFPEKSKKIQQPKRQCRERFPEALETFKRDDWITVAYNNGWYPLRYWA